MTCAKLWLLFIARIRATSQASRARLTKQIREHRRVCVVCNGIMEKPEDANHPVKKP